MKKLFLLSLIFVLRVLWQRFPYSNNPKDWIAFFPFSKQTLPWQNYVFNGCEKLSWALLSFVLFMEAKKHRVGMFFFMVVQIFIFIEYFFNYNNDWRYNGERIEVIGIVLSSNTIGALIFGLAFIYEIRHEFIHRQNIT